MGLVWVLQFAVAEGLVWRAVEMVQRLDLDALSEAPGEKHVAAATDTPVQIALVSFADLAAAVRLAFCKGLEPHLLRIPVLPTCVLLPDTCTPNIEPYVVLSL